MLLYAVLCFLITLISCIAIIRLSRKKKFLIKEEVHRGPQKVHTIPTPRLGGIGLFLALTTSVIVAYLRQENYFFQFLNIYIPSVIVFLTGLVEDLKGNLHPFLRLFLFSLAGIIAFFLGNVQIIRIDISFFDHLLTFKWLSLIFTIVAIAGLINAINIIDGFNGLASMIGFSILLAIAYVGYKYGDYFIATLCVILSFSLFGFFLLNYPFGLIFLGDSGAYLTGYFIACLVILLVYRHSEVSAWFALTVNSYPVYETLFSIYRRKLRKRPATKPDALHLHTLLYKIVVKKIFGVDNPLYKNPAVSPLLWILNLWVIIPAILFYNNGILLALTFFSFCIIYTFSYYKIIKLKVPRWYFEQKKKI